MLSEVNCVVENLPSAKNSGQHHCHICFKVCLSVSGLLKLVKSKHSENLSSNEESSKLIFPLNSFIEKSAGKLAKDACFFSSDNGLTVFSFNYFEVQLALSFFFFFPSGRLSVVFDI